MCRNIKTLFNFEPPATEDEIHASALQFVRKLSGFNKPSQANAEAFDLAVAEVSASARRLLSSGLPAVTSENGRSIERATSLPIPGELAASQDNVDRLRRLGKLGRFGKSPAAKANVPKRQHAIAASRPAPVYGAPAPVYVEEPPPCRMVRERFWDGYGWRMRRVQVCD